MSKIFKKKLNQMAGFSILEVLIALAILSVMGSAAALMVGGTFQGNSNSIGGMQVIEQVENAAYWINHDVLMAQTIEPGVEGFLRLTWQGANYKTNRVVYTISDSVLKRKLYIDSVAQAETILARNINPDSAKTSCTFEDGVLNLQLTSTIGTRSETRNYRILTRIEQAS